MSEYIPIISSLTALIAIIVGPCISFKIARMQIEAPQKQEWRNNLINLGSQYTTLVTHFSGEVVTGKNIREIEGFIEFRILADKFSIILNDKNKDQMALKEIAGEIWDCLFGEQESYKDAVKELEALAEAFKAQLRKVINAG